MRNAIVINGLLAKLESRILLRGRPVQIEIPDTFLGVP
jgi:deoxyadenosine/deoxycytidine kinase